jgi:hypothetical protein
LKRKVDLRGHQQPKEQKAAHLSQMTGETIASALASENLPPPQADLGQCEIHAETSSR